MKLTDSFTMSLEGMNVPCFRPSKKGTFLTSLQGCIYGVSEMRDIHSMHLASHFINRIARLSVLVFVVACLSACASKKPMADDPAFAPAVAANMPIPQRTDGSLYQDSYGMSLFDDRKAHYVGDVITVTLSEKTVSKKSSGVAVKKNSSVDIDAGTILGGVAPAYKGLGLETAIGQDRTFAGDSDADQSNSLEGNITVTVAEILPNGNLIVRGEKWITLNRGDEFIRISGIVRPDDIAPDNTIISTRLANAKISYSGTGALADSQSMGWMSRFFNSDYWPF